MGIQSCARPWAITSITRSAMQNLPNTSVTGAPFIRGSIATIFGCIREPLVHYPDAAGGVNSLRRPEGVEQRRGKEPFLHDVKKGLTPQHRGSEPKAS